MKFLVNIMVDKKSVNKVVIILLIIGVFVATFMLLKPIIISIFWGLFVAYILHPLYIPIKKLIKYNNLSAITFSLLIIILVVVPILYFLPLFVREIFNSYIAIQRINLEDVVVNIFGSLFSTEITKTIVVQLNLFVVKFFSATTSFFSNSFADLPNIMLKFAIFAFTFYFATKDSEKIKNYFEDISPFSENTKNKFSEEFRNITNSVVFGQIVVGIIQGLSLGLGMWLLGIPKVIFLTIVAIIASIMPIVGAWLVWIPASLYLFMSGNTLGGIILFLYGLLFVSTIDNILRPYFISKKSNVGIFVAIIGTLAGLYVFGVVGLILGPLILSYLLIILEFYREGRLNELLDK